jgi:hypothetical protein
VLREEGYSAPTAIGVAAELSHVLGAQAIAGARRGRMDSLAVANYPTVRPRSFDWIQAIRAEFDQLYFEVIDPHFSFVFPAFGQGRHQRVHPRLPGARRGTQRHRQASR